MKMKLKRCLTIAGFLLVFFLVPLASAFELSLEGLEGGIRQGDVALLKARSESPLLSLSGVFDGEKIFFEPEGSGVFSAIIGVGMEMEPGQHDLSLSGRSSNEAFLKNIRFEVLKRNYKVERLSLPKKMVTPDPSLMARISRESQSLGKVKRLLTADRFWDGDFIKPVKGPFANNFGARRILNGVNKKPHSGLDIKAFKGTKIVSPNKGKVIYIEVMYYGGKTVVIDHGQGLSTLYMHLSKIFVNHGDEVEKGEVIGLVGSTGRSTGPHLHWGAYMNGEKVDPSSLLKLAIDENLNNTNVAKPVEGKMPAGQLGGS